MKFSYIAPGTFIMGSPKRESGHFSGDERQHKVTLTKGFYMQTTEVTQGQWFAVMGTKPWMGKNGLRAHIDENPENAASWITWHMCQNFIKKLNEKEYNIYLYKCQILCLKFFLNTDDILILIPLQIIPP